MKCENCNTKLSCGCKKRVANDGTSCCTACVAGYNLKLDQNKTSSTGVNPTSIKVVYNGPGTQINP